MLGWLLGSTRQRIRALYGLGILLALGYFAAAYFGSPTDGPPVGCSDCGDYWGRRWEPWLVVYIELFALIAWCAGVVSGAGLRRLTRSR